jgi:hypothetical protein
MSGTTSKARINTPTSSDDSLPVSAGNAGYTKTSSKRSTRSSGKKSSSSSSDPQKDKQLAMDTTGENFAREKAAIEKQTKDNLNDIQRQRKANDALLKQTNADIMTQVNWQPAQQKEQSTFAALRNRMGNAAYGSGIQDLVEGMRRVDDMNDAELIGTYKANMSDAYKNWYQAESDLIADYNDKASQAEYNMTDLRNRYSAALNNIKPGAGLAKNVNKASKQAVAETKTKKVLDAAKKEATKARMNAVLPPSQRVQNIQQGLATGDKDTMRSIALSGGVNAATRKASNPLDVIMPLLSANQKKDKAQKAYDKASKRVTVGKGDEAINVPNININPSANFKALVTKRLTNPTYQNPSLDYVRGTGQHERIGGKTGAWNRAGAANKRGFLDNLSVFKNV